ncbi:MAG TPA: hypothetical protein VFM11_10530 [Burkholderiales bacterium]|nr:hypothetical protein [Burkholderiales bacterium]
MNMNRIAACAAGIATLCLAGTVWAKLPSPTPQQQTQAKEAAAKKAAADAKQKQELAAVEDKIVAQYKARNNPGKAPAASAAPTASTPAAPAAAAPADGNTAK